MRTAIGLLMCFLLALAGNAAHAQTFPALTGRVVDEADLLDPAQEAALTAKLAGLETSTQRQFVVATLKSLQGYEISDYGYQLGRKWAIGQDGKGESEKDNGVILIVAPNERKMRIEVGYQLEPFLTDGLSSSIIRNDITPRFKAGDFAGGINAGADKIITQLQLPPEQAAKIAAAASAAAKKRATQSSGPDIGTILFLLFLFFFVILPILRSFSKSGRRYGNDVGPVIIWGGGDWGGGGGSSWGGGGGGGFGGFSGGGGSFGGGGASGGW